MPKVNEKKAKEIKNNNNNNKNNPFKAYNTGWVVN